MSEENYWNEFVTFSIFNVILLLIVLVREAFQAEEEYLENSLYSCRHGSKNSNHKKTRIWRPKSFSWPLHWFVLVKIEMMKEGKTMLGENLIEELKVQGIYNANSKRKARIQLAGIALHKGNEAFVENSNLVVTTTKRKNKNILYFC